VYEYRRYLLRPIPTKKNKVEKFLGATEEFKTNFGFEEIFVGFLAPKFFGGKIQTFLILRGSLKKLF
jgi:hypothetical protein